jgi:hypothetical protein
LNIDRAKPTGPIVHLETLRVAEVAPHLGLPVPDPFVDRPFENPRFPWAQGAEFRTSRPDLGGRARPGGKIYLECPRKR